MPTRKTLNPTKKKKKPRSPAEEKAYVDAYMAKASRNVKPKTPPPEETKPKGGFFSGLDYLKEVLGGKKKN